jgi:hypothetical protein
MLAVRERFRGGTVVDGPPPTPGGSVLMQPKHGISVPRSLIEDCDDEDHLEWISRVRQDNMGMSMIAYWPGVSIAEDDR